MGKIERKIQRILDLQGQVVWLFEWIYKLPSLTQKVSILPPLP